MFAARHERQGNPDPVRILVLTFNRTLAGYVRSLAAHQIEAGLSVDLQIDTFGRWGWYALSQPNVQDQAARNKLRKLASALHALSPDYIVKEVEYLLGRFEPERLEEYITAERTGRGTLPRVDRQLRRRILDDVVAPYQSWLGARNALDWNGVAVRMTRDIESFEYDVIVVDESQDFSANQLRAVRYHLAPEHAVTFVIDTVQRIYARGFTWTEVGFDIRPERFHTLRANYRNTVEIAAFAASILRGMRTEADGALPNLDAATAHGPLPIVLRGRYSRQVDWAMKYVRDRVDLRENSVAFLKPQGGRWFDQIRRALIENDYNFADITREADWPEGPENIALCTFHSAKGLEFDYVFILGFNAEVTPYVDAELDDQVLVLRRLLAVAVARARKAVVIGYKIGEQTQLVQFFAAGSFAEETV